MEIEKEMIIKEMIKNVSPPSRGRHRTLIDDDFVNGLESHISNAL